MSGFLAALLSLAPLLIQIAPALIPGLHPAAVPHIINAVHTAELIPGATGQQKMAAAISIATQSLQVAQEQGVPIDASMLNTQIPAAVQSVVDVVNALKPHHAALSTPAAPPKV